MTKKEVSFCAERGEHVSSVEVFINWAVDVDCIGEEGTSVFEFIV